MRSPPRPPNVIKHAKDVLQHHEGKEIVAANMERLLALANKDHDLRQLYLDTFFAIHQSRAVHALRYDPRGTLQGAYIDKNCAYSGATLAHPTAYLTIIAPTHRALHRWHRSPVFVGSHLFTLPYERQRTELTRVAYPIARIFRSGFPQFPVDILPDGHRTAVTPYVFGKLATIYALSREVQRDSHGIADEDRLLASIRLDATRRQLSHVKPLTLGEERLSELLR